jgi:hypothetical protein
MEVWINALKELQATRNVSEVWSFIGVVGHYRHLIPAFSLIAAPLTALKQKSRQFEWTEEEQIAYLRLSNAVHETLCPLEDGNRVIV